MTGKGERSSAKKFDWLCRFNVTVRKHMPLTLIQYTKQTDRSIFMQIIADKPPVLLVYSIPGFIYWHYVNVTFYDMPNKATKIPKNDIHFLNISMSATKTYIVFWWFN